MTSESAILTRLRELATDPGARGLRDDVALLDGLVLTHDAIVEGVHYLPTDPPESVGWKLAAVNLSDLAAKGATPAGALLSLTLAGGQAWESRFLDGLSECCRQHGLPLLGGDTVALPSGAPRVLGLTAIGRAGPMVPSRGGGRPGDRLWVAGTIGDSGAGLAQLRDDPRATGPLVESYRRPKPLLAEGTALAAAATALMDVSDGLLLDARRLADASDCGLRLRLDHVPLSDAFTAQRGEDRGARLFAATAGDDYALLGAFPPDFDPFTLWKAKWVNIRLVGELTEDGAFVLADDRGTMPLPEQLGHEHRTS